MVDFYNCHFTYTLNIKFYVCPNNWFELLTLKYWSTVIIYYLWRYSNQMFCCCFFCLLVLNKTHQQQTDKLFLLKRLFIIVAKICLYVLKIWKTNNIGLNVHEWFSEKALLLNVVKCYCALSTVITAYGPHHANGMTFSSHDRDQDTSLGNCAQIRHGAWWFWNCSYENPNGPYLTPGTSSTPSMNYGAFLGRYESLRTMKIMFR